MKVESYRQPKSSFLSMDKDMKLLANIFTANKRLQKLLYWTTPDALDKPALNAAQCNELFKNNIKLVPKLYIDSSVLNYIVISFDDFIPNEKNPEFRDNLISFDIVCHFDQWQLQDFQLRPYRIAAEIDSLIDKRHLTGIGKVEFESANQILLNNEFAGLNLSYRAVHGEEDKKFMPNPDDEEQFLNNFNEMFNSDDAKCQTLDLPS